MSTSNKVSGTENQNLKLRRNRNPSRPFEHTLIAILGVFSALMLGISLSILSPQSGPLENFKILLITCSAGLVAYAVNFFAITKGAAQAAIGYALAAFISVAAMLAVGSGMFIGALTGLTHESVHQRILEEAGAQFSTHIGGTHQIALEAARAAPALKIVADDLEGYAQCEKQSSCLSSVGHGGYGPVAAELHKLAKRSAAIATAFENGEMQRKSLLPDLNRLNSRYQKKLSDTNLNLDQRRAALQAIHTEMTQVSMALSEALPVDLLESYTEELTKGVAISGQPQASSRINQILREHAKSLSDVLDALDDEGLAPPAFPPRPGMMDSLSFLGDFAAFAAVIFVAELVLPITLWVLTYLKLAWEIERRSPPPSDNDQQNHDPFDGLVHLPPIVTERYQPHSLNGRGDKKRPGTAK